MYRDFNHVVLALHGWERDENESTLTCQFCFRKCGLWNYAFDSNETKPKFDPILEHESFCPWIILNPTFKKSGWEFCLDTLTEAPSFL